MLEHQFYCRIVVNVIFGIMFTSALYHMAQYNNREFMPSKHIVMKVLGGIFLLLACIDTVMFILSLCEMNLSESMAESFLGSSSIIRSSYTALMREEPTPAQRMTLNLSLDVFSSLGFATYFFLFKSSHSKWYSKIGKFFLVLLLSVFYVNSFTGIVSLSLFLVLWLFIIVRNGSLSSEVVTKESTIPEGSSDESLSTITDERNINDEPQITDSVTALEEIISSSTFEEEIAPRIEENVTETFDDGTSAKGESETNKTEAPRPNTNATADATMFCKYCGKLIDADSLFCRFCGGDLREKKRIWAPKLLFKHQLKAQIMGHLKKFKHAFGENKNKSKLHNIFSKKIDMSTTLFEKITGIILLLLFSLGIVFYLSSLHLYGSILPSWFLDNILLLLIASAIAFLIYALLCWKCNRVWKFYLRRIVLLLLTISIFFVYLFIQQDVKSDFYKEAVALSSKDKRLEYIKNTFSETTKYEYVYYSMDSNLLNAVINEAENGDSFSQGVLGDYYYGMIYNDYSKELEEEDYPTLERAFYWWMRAAKSNDARGLFRLGDCFAKLTTSSVPEKDLAIAYYYWAKAANLGWGMAYVRLGDLMGTWNLINAIEISLSTQEEKGRDYWTDEVGKTHYSAAYNLPKGWHIDLKKARDYWNKAVKAGGAAEEEAKIRLERVYTEDILEMRREQNRGTSE